MLKKRIKIEFFKYKYYIAFWRCYFIMRAKHNKKNSKNKNIENNTNTQYEEKYNDVILNDLVPEERKEEFNIQEGKNQPRKRARKNGFKFNVGKKTKNQNKQQQEEANSKVSKHNKKSNEEVEQTTQPTEQKKSKKTRPRQHHKKQGTQQSQGSAKSNTETEVHKHAKKRVHKHRKQPQNHEETLNIQEVEQNTSQESEEVDDTENITYRGEEAEQQAQDNIGISDKNIIWSDENFDR